MELKKISLPIRLKKPVIAFGPQVKNTVCFARDNTAWVSPLHQDLQEPVDFLRFREDVKRLLARKPLAIACDLHPAYLSTDLAVELSARTSLPLLPIQHHHAHIAAAMVENRLLGQKVIGVAFDGTGFGSDGTLWGSEFLICDYCGFKRYARLLEAPLPGGEAAIAHPWRVAAFWLNQIYKDKFFRLGIPWCKKIDPRQWRLLAQMQAQGINSPLSSSMGRLFDAAASITLAKKTSAFEAQLPMESEKAAARYAGKRAAEAGNILYRAGIVQGQAGYIIDPRPIIKSIVGDLKNGLAKEKVAWRFHQAIAGVVREVCLKARDENRINKVVLSGGVFQNNLLLRLTLDLLYGVNFEVFTHKILPCNDGCVALGQAVIAGLSTRRR